MKKMTKQEKDHIITEMTKQMEKDKTDVLPVEAVSKILELRNHRENFSQFVRSARGQLRVFRKKKHSYVSIKS